MSGDFEMEFIFPCLASITVGYAPQRHEGSSVFPRPQRVDLGRDAVSNSIEELDLHALKFPEEEKECFFQIAKLLQYRVWSVARLRRIDRFKQEESDFCQGSRLRRL